MDEVDDQSNYLDKTDSGKDILNKDENNNITDKKNDIDRSKDNSSENDNDTTSLKESTKNDDASDWFNETDSGKSIPGEEESSDTTDKESYIERSEDNPSENENNASSLKEKIRMMIAMLGNTRIRWVAN